MLSNKIPLQRMLDISVVPARYVPCSLFSIYISVLYPPLFLIAKHSLFQNTLKTPGVCAYGAKRLYMILFSWQHGNHFPPVAKTRCQQCSVQLWFLPSNNLIVRIQTLQFQSNVMSLEQIHFEILEIKFTAKLRTIFLFHFQMSY